MIKKFENFSYKHLNLTSQLKNDKDFKKVAKEYDLFVSGSDQIWNPKIVSENGVIDTHYFLDFAIGKKKISYASSIGTYRYKEDETTQVVSLLNRYDFLSVREKDSSQYLSKLLNRDVYNVLEPTLLHSKNEWLQLFNI